MPAKVLVRGFAPDIPEDQVVAFCDDLPSNAVCAQCDNVSATLHRDPEAHGYCPSCMKMCSNEDIFECPTCERKFHVSQLTVDRSARDKIKTLKVICPNATPENPVQITFNAIKAHLSRCSCGQIAEAPADTDQPASLPFSSMKMFKCPRCNEYFAKKLVGPHIKGCKGPRKAEPTQKQQVLSPEVNKQGHDTPKASDQSPNFPVEADMADPANQDTPSQFAPVWGASKSVCSEGANGMPSVQDSPYCKMRLVQEEGKTPAKIPDYLTGSPPYVTDEPPQWAMDPYTLAQELIEARNVIKEMKAEFAKLKEASKKSEHPPNVTHEPSQRAIDPQLFQFAEKLNKAQSEISDLKDENRKLKEELRIKDGTLSMMKEEAESRQQEAQLAIRDLKGSVAASLGAFQEECDRLRDGVAQLSSNIMQVTQSFQQELENIVGIMFPPGQELCRQIFEQP